MIKQQKFISELLSEKTTLGNYNKLVELMSQLPNSFYQFRYFKTRDDIKKDVDRLIGEIYSTHHLLPELKSMTAEGSILGANPNAYRSYKRQLTKDKARFLEFVAGFMKGREAVKGINSNVDL